jgi:hypothetical protein
VPLVDRVGLVTGHLAIIDDLPMRGNRSASRSCASSRSGPRAEIERLYEEARPARERGAAAGAGPGRRSSPSTRRADRFEDIREAHRVMEANEANGKLVVRL